MSGSTARTTHQGSHNQYLRSTNGHAPAEHGGRISELMLHAAIISASPGTCLSIIFEMSIAASAPK